MITITEQYIKDYKDKLDKIAKSFDLDKQKIIVEELTIKVSAPDFWDDFENATTITKELNTAKEKIKDVSHINMLIDDLETALMYYKEFEGKDEEELVNLANAELIKEFKIFENKYRFIDPTDSLGAVLDINAGAGGTEANDWANMLFRMYDMWAKSNGYKFKILYYSEGDKVGIKNVSIEITGNNAYGTLKGETGVHRLVRVSPYNAQGKRMTSFAAVSVVPLVDNSIKVEIDESKLTIDTFRSSGAGGQNVNKVESGVRVNYMYTDPDTGETEKIQVANTETRDQPKNKERAMQILKSILYKKALDKQLAKKKEIEDAKLKNEWGAQIRSYVFDDKRVKDHRTGYQTTDVDSVMNGNLNGFIESYNNWIIEQENNKL
jgi:peptide chain release factor 2